MYAPTTNRTKLYTCYTCGGQFKGYRNLITHKKSWHKKYPDRDLRMRETLLQKMEFHLNKISEGLNYKERILYEKEQSLYNLSINLLERERRVLLQEMLATRTNIPSATPPPIPPSLRPPSNTPNNNHAPVSIDLGLLYSTPDVENGSVSTYSIDAENETREQREMLSTSANLPSSTRPHLLSPLNSPNNNHIPVSIDLGLLDSVTDIENGSVSTYSVDTENETWEQREISAIFDEEERKQTYNKHVEDNEKCGVCLLQLNQVNIDDVVVLKCKHIICNFCCNSMLVYTLRNCPVCRAQF